MIELRDYQLDKMVKPTIEAMKEGHKDVLNVASTGAGKTAVACWWADKALQKDSNTLMLVHKNTILGQFARTATNAGLSPNIIASGMPETNGKLQIAMVSTLINRLDLYPKFDFIISDESHHLRESNMWGKVFKHYKTVNPNMKTIGFTATPNGRTDKLGLHPFFTEMVDELSCKHLVNEGWLVYPHTVRGVKTEQPKFHITNGDYDKKEQLEHFSKKQIIGDTIDSYHQFLDGVPNIVSCVGLEHAYNVQKNYERAAREKGKSWKAVMIQGGKKYEKQMFDALAGLASGSVQIVTFVDVLGEGVDVPAATGIQLLRKMKSYVLYKQFIGRILRPMWPDWFNPNTATKLERLAVIAQSPKPRGEVQDFAGNTIEHFHPLYDREWSLLDDRELKDRDTIKLPNQTICISCGGVFPGKVITCPDCGCNIEEEIAKKSADRTPEEIEGELVEVGETGKTEQEVKELTEEAERIRALDPAERQKEMLASLRRNGNNDKSKELARAVGYKDGWTNYIYNKKIVRR